MAKTILTILNTLISIVVAIAFFLLAGYSVYALWDNNQVYAAAENVQEDMLKLKPVVEEGEEGASFEELLKINKDVCAWVTLDGTAIDYPVLQGEDILTYLNKDVYGKFALAGSIFLDTANDRNFTDSYSLVYGHHMANHKMFGDLELYEEEDFFKQNTTGTLILPDKIYDLEIFAVLQVKSSEESIFEPAKWFTDINGLLAFAEENALYLHKDTLKRVQEDENPQVLGLSTCSSDFTDARTVVLARMVRHSSNK